MTSDSVPQYQTLLWPSVVALRDLGGRATNTELYEAVVELEEFTEAQQSVLHKDGPMTEIEYRMRWAQTYLKGMGLAANPSRGVWELTAEGRTVVEGQIMPLRAEYLRGLRDARRAREVTDLGGIPGETDGGIEEEVAWQDQLLEVLLAMPPDAFERLCVRLLREAGFVRTQVTGRTGDQGIDGVGVYRVSLVSFPVFFQAKRWRNSVGSQQVRDFRGAMVGRGEKGLLITTASFTSEAKAEASRDGAPPVDLVDGPLLCELLAQHEIGVRVTERVVREITLVREDLERM